MYTLCWRVPRTATAEVVSSHQYEEPGCHGILLSGVLCCSCSCQANTFSTSCMMHRLPHDDGDVSLASSPSPTADLNQWNASMTGILFSVYHCLSTTSYKKQDLCGWCMHVVGMADAVLLLPALNPLLTDAPGRPQGS